MQQEQGLKLIRAVREAERVAEEQDRGDVADELALIRHQLADELGINPLETY